MISMSVFIVAWPWNKYVTKQNFSPFLRVQDIQSVFGRPNVIGVKIDNQKTEDFEEELANDGDSSLRQKLKVVYGENAKDAIIQVSFKKLELYKKTIVTKIST